MDTSRLRPRSVLMLAFAASLLLHLVITQWDVRFSDPIESMPPLTATITELPPPPAPAPAPRPTPKPKAKRSVRVATFRAPAAAVVAQAEPAVEQAAEAPQGAAPDPPPAAAAPLDEPVAAATEIQPLPKQLPPRIDLAYRAFLGTRGFFIGDAVYRLE
ncbi:MAG TPA: hypothetical protein VIM74_06445, partial [Casimicrobiaceae bacterium]